MKAAALHAALALAAALALPGAARATSFRLPLSGCDEPTKCVDTNKCYVTAYYDHNGNDWNCGTEQYDGHVGSDYGVQGTYGVRPVVAGAVGTVLETNDGCGTGAWGSTCGGGFGNFVKLSHSDGKVTIYGHMFAGTLKVSKGASVTCGQELGRAGSSGNSTGPHVHFEVIDPTYGSDDPYSGTCGGPLTYWVDQGDYCRLPAVTCEGACTKDCTGKVCGPDGCGGTCGTCAIGQACSTDGLCSITTDDAIYVSETTPDGTHFKPGEKFTKTWTMKNNGLTAWTKTGGYTFAFQRQEDFDAPVRTWPDAGESIAPGAEKTWIVPMTAPLAPGNYTGFWRMENNGAAFGDEVWVAITVDEPAGGVDGALFVDETIPDDTRFVANTVFTKTWTMYNSGTTSWSKAGGYRWKFSRGDQLGAPAAVDFADGEVIAPYTTKTFSVPMKAPATAGTYRGYWAIVRDDQGFAGEVWVEIIVNPTMPNDADGDGVSPPDDCNDNDPEAYPGNLEKCDGKDNDCNGATDESLTRECYKPCKGTEHCVKGAWANCDGAAPGNEQCNGLDDNCNGFTDDQAYCPTGQLCVATRCVAIERPDAGTPPAKVDAGTPAAADGGTVDGKKFDGGGCGCSLGEAAGAPWLPAALLGLALARRRRGRP